MKLLLKNIKGNCNKEEKQEEDNKIFRYWAILTFYYYFSVIKVRNNLFKLFKLFNKVNSNT